MDNKKFHVKVLRPEGTMYDNPVDLVSFPAGDGEVAVLADHAPFLCAMGMGILKIQENENKVIYFFTQGGIAEVKDNHMCFLTDYIQTPESLDKEQIEKELETVQEKSTTAHYSAQDRQKDIERCQLMLKTLAKLNN